MKRLIAASAVVLLAACAKTAATAPPSANGIGYVRMDELVKKHPLYGQLAQYDRSIDALNLAQVVPRATSADDRTRAQEADLQKELTTAADRTQKLLADKQKQYQTEENAAIAAALRGGAANGASAGQIVGGINATAAGQHAAASSSVLRDLDAYRTQLQRQDAAQLEATQKALVAKADRTYRAKADQLQQGESALTLRVANEDAAQRLALRTKLSSLALDDAARDDVQKQLGALDRRESDAIAKTKNSDQQTLQALQAELRAGVGRDLHREADRVHARSLALFQQRQKQLAGIPGTTGPVVPVVVATGPDGKRIAQANPALPAEVRERVQTLHEAYQKRFEADAKKTVADFEKTRGDLSKRYALIHGVDVDAQRDAVKTAGDLHRKRDELYGQIAGQISREVKLLAQQRGISVVVSDPVAPVAGVDLTPDALKDIESLHE